MKTIKTIGLILIAVAISCVALFGCEKNPAPTPPVNGETNNSGGGVSKNETDAYYVTLNKDIVILNGNDMDTVEVSAKKGEAVIENPALIIIYENDSDSEGVTVTADGAKVTAKTKQVLEEKTISVYVVLKHGGKQTDGVAKLTINLIPPQKSIQQAASDFEIKDGIYYTRLMLTEGGDLPTNKALNFVAYNSGKTVDAEIKWKPVKEDGYDSETCLITDDGKIKANKFGKGLFEATAVIDNEEVKVRLVCETVKRTVDLTSEVNKAEIVVNKLNGDKYTFNYPNAAGSIESLKYGETVLSSSVDGNEIAYDKQAFNGDVFGLNKTLTVETEKEIYKVKFDVITDKISSISEWNAIATSGCKSGYYKLISNIDFINKDQITIENFSGTIDGNGYALYNVQLNGTRSLFKGLNGVVKNLSIEIKHSGWNNSIAIFTTNSVAGRVAHLENIYVKLWQLSTSSGLVFGVSNGSDPVGDWHINGFVLDVNNQDPGKPLDSYFGLFGQISNAGKSYVKTAKNIVAVNVPETLKGRITKPWHTSLYNCTGGLLNVYVDGTNGVTFPATGWDNKYWQVDAVNKKVYWRANL